MSGLCLFSDFPQGCRGDGASSDVGDYEKTCGANRDTQWGDGSSRAGGSGMEVMLIENGDGRGDNNGAGDCDDEDEGSDGGAGGDGDGVTLVTGDDGSTTGDNSGSGDRVY